MPTSGVTSSRAAVSSTPGLEPAHQVRIALSSAERPDTRDARHRNLLGRTGACSSMLPPCLESLSRRSQPRSLLSQVRCCRAHRRRIWSSSTAKSSPSIATFSIHEGVAIIGDRIITIGNDDQMRTLAGPATRIDRSEGQCRHSGSDGQPPARRRRRSRRRSVGARIAGRRRRRHRRPREQIASPATLILSNSDWHEAQLKEQRLPLRDDLDKIAPQNPVVLVRGGHEYILNSAALTRWGITETRRSRPAAASRSIRMAA